MNMKANIIVARRFSIQSSVRGFTIGGLVGLVMLLGSMSTAVANQLIVHDDFDDGVLDPAWEVRFGTDDGNGEVTGWDYDESETQPSESLETS